MYVIIFVGIFEVLLKKEFLFIIFRFYIKLKIIMLGILIFFFLINYLPKIFPGIESFPRHCSVLRRA